MLWIILLIVVVVPVYLAIRWARGSEPTLSPEQLAHETRMLEIDCGLYKETPALFTKCDCTDCTWSQKRDNLQSVSDILQKARVHIDTLTSFLDNTWTIQSVANVDGHVFSAMQKVGHESLVKIARDQVNKQITDEVQAYVDSQRAVRYDPRNTPPIQDHPEFVQWYPH